MTNPTGSQGPRGGFNPELSSLHSPAAVDHLAQAAIAEVRTGMVVGLGTGRTASRAIKALAKRIRDERLDIDCVCSSMVTEAVARELGMPVIPFADVESVDYSFDGADEVDHELRMLKGHHGAITRQRLVAHVSRRCVYLAHEDKLVQRLGEKALLAVTIIPFGVASTRNRLRDLGLSGVLRRTMEGEVFVTDGGGVVLDMQIPHDCDVGELAMALDHVPGVVDHGLFLTEADEVLVESKKGEIRKLLPKE